MPTFTRAPSDVRDLIAEVMADYHPELVEAGVTVSALMAIPTEKEQANDPPHLRHQGYGAAATIQVNSYEKRVQGIADVTIKIDDETWRALDEEGRIALIDHELEHCCVALSKDGEIKTDDCGRPKIKLLNHDFQIGVFNSVIERHGLKSIDAQVVQQVFRVYRQRLFDWADDMAPQNAAPADVLGMSRSA